MKSTVQNSFNNESSKEQTKKIHNSQMDILELKTQYIESLSGSVNDKMEETEERTGGLTWRILQIIQKNTGDNKRLKKIFEP